MGQLISYLDRLYSIKLKKIKTLRKHFLQNKFNQLTLFFFFVWKICLLLEPEYILLLSSLFLWKKRKKKLSWFQPMIIWLIGDIYNFMPNQKSNPQMIIEWCNVPPLSDMADYESNRCIKTVKTVEWRGRVEEAFPGHWNIQTPQSHPLRRRRSVPAPSESSWNGLDPFPSLIEARKGKP